MLHNIHDGYGTKSDLCRERLPKLEERQNKFYTGRSHSRIGWLWFACEPSSKKKQNGTHIFGLKSSAYIVCSPILFSTWHFIQNNCIWCVAVCARARLGSILCSMYTHRVSASYKRWSFIRPDPWQRNHKNCDDFPSISNWTSDLKHLNWRSCKVMVFFI